MKEEQESKDGGIAGVVTIALAIYLVYLAASILM